MSTEPEPALTLLPDTTCTAPPGNTAVATPADNTTLAPVLAPLEPTTMLIGPAVPLGAEPVVARTYPLPPLADVPERRSTTTEAPNKAASAVRRDSDPDPDPVLLPLDTRTEPPREVVDDAPAVMLTLPPRPELELPT